MLILGDLGDRIIDGVQVPQILAPIHVELRRAVGATGTVGQRADHRHQHHHRKEHEHRIAHRPATRGEVQRHHPDGGHDHGHGQQPRERIARHRLRDVRWALHRDLTVNNRRRLKARFPNELHRTMDVEIRRSVPSPA